MDKEKIIHEFIDGNLDARQEEKLFLEMSSDPDLRSEFKQQMVIKNAVRGDTKAFTPKAASTMAIFNELGFSSGAGAGGAAAASSSAPKPAASPSIWKKYAQGMSSGLTAALGTAAIFLIFFSFGMFDGKRQAGQTQNEELKSHEPVPVIISQELPAQTVYENKYRKQAYPAYARRRTSENSNNSQMASRFQPQNRTFETKDYGFTADDIKSAFPLMIKPNQNSNASADNSLTNAKDKNINDRLALNSQNNANNIIPRKNNGSFFENVAVEVNGSAFYQESDNMNPGEGYQKFNNMGIQMFYALNDQLKVGMEYKRENYYQKFQGLDVNGMLWEYKQHPNFQSYGFTVRYTPDYLKYKFIKPALQTTVGGNNAGPYGRALAGAEFKINENFNVTLGADYSILFYNHNNTYFDSDKYGVYFGTGIKF